jgi:ferric-dicitrate binding protein FerR (iron transport regulator)
LVLPDGTKVWLNAASSITYPVAFGNERKVKITGEVYFDVVHDATKSFKVVAGKTEITDIGTEFNVYAYYDEEIMKTTLLEGAVKVNGKLLDPGQQAQVDKNAQIKVINLTNAEDVIAWKRGLINFNATDIPALLRQIGRWYNIEVKIQGKLPDIYLTGTIPRNTKLSSVVKILELNNLKCSIQENKLLISAK